MCAFAIASSGRRCLLETYTSKDGEMEYQRETSVVVVEGISGYIESDRCVRACGVDRRTVGFLSDKLLKPNFIAKLCKPACYDHCPNIIDLYSDLASGEGVNSGAGSHRMMTEAANSGAAVSPRPSPSSI